MVDYSSLILALLATPGTVGIAHKMSKGISIMDSLQSHDLGDSMVGTTFKNLNPLGSE